MTDKETITVYDNQAEAYAKLVANEADKTLLKFIEILKPNNFVLDLGCGPANASATMREHGLKADPVDASAEMVRMANETYDIAARQASFADISSTDTYDAIWASFSLLHADRADLPAILATLHKALKSGGYFHLTMKLGEGEARDKFGRFYTYYSQEELSNHLANAGFTIDSIETGEVMGMAGKVEPWIMLLTQKG